MDLLEKASYEARFKNSDYKMMIRRYEAIMSKYSGDSEGFISFAEAGIMSDIWTIIKKLIKTLVNELGWFKKDDTENYVNKIKERVNLFIEEFKKKFNSNDFKTIDKNDSKDVKKTIKIDKELMGVIKYIADHDPTLTGFEGDVSKSLLDYVDDLTSTGLDEESIKNNLVLWAFKFGYRTNFRIFSINKDDQYANDLLTSLSKYAAVSKILISSSILRPLEESKTYNDERKRDANDSLSSDVKYSDDKKNTPRIQDHLKDDKDTDFTYSYEKQNNLVKSLDSKKGKDLKVIINDFSTEILNEMTNKVEYGVSSLLRSTDRNSAISNSELSIMDDNNRWKIIISFVSSCSSALSEIVDNIISPIIKEEGNIKEIEFSKVTRHVTTNSRNGNSVTKSDVVDTNKAEIEDIFDLAIVQNNIIKSLIITMGNSMKILSTMVERLDNSTKDPNSKYKKSNNISSSDVDYVSNKNKIVNKITQQGDADNESISKTKENVEKNAEDKVNEKTKAIDDYGNSRSENYYRYIRSMENLFGYGEANVDVHVEENENGDVTNTTVYGPEEVNNKKTSDNFRQDINGGNMKKDFLRNKHNTVNRDIKETSSNSYRLLGIHWNSLLKSVIKYNRLLFEFTQHNNKVFKELNSGNNPNVVSPSVIFKNPKEFKMNNDKLKESYDVMKKIVDSEVLSNEIQKINEDLRKIYGDGNEQINLRQLKGPSVNKIVDIFVYSIYVESILEGLKGNNQGDPFFYNLKDNTPTSENTVLVEEVIRLAKSTINKLNNMLESCVKGTPMNQETIIGIINGDKKLENQLLKAKNAKSTSALISEMKKHVDSINEGGK